MDEVVVRARREADLDRCVAALRVVHRADGYPLNWPADPRGWLAPPGLRQAWVAEWPRGVLAGHAAVQRVSDAGAEGNAAGPRVELSRLFVAPAARRRSVATALLEHAAHWAADRGHDLTLNVVAEDRSAAVSFYEANGWRHTHTTTADWTAPDGAPVRLRYYVLSTAGSGAAAGEPRHPVAGEHRNGRLGAAGDQQE